MWQVLLSKVALVLFMTGTAAYVVAAARSVRALPPGAITFPLVVLAIFGFGAQFRQVTQLLGFLQGLRIGEMDIQQIVQVEQSVLFMVGGLAMLWAVLNAQRQTRKAKGRANGPSD